MKQAKRILVSFMTLALILTAMVMSVFADEGSTHPGPHFEAAVSAETANVGDTFTVTVSSSEMTVNSVYGGLVYDSSKVEVKNIEMTDLAVKDGSGKLSMNAQEGQSSNVGFYGTGIGDITYTANTALMKVTFEAKAAGTVQFALYENVDGTDEYYADLTNPYGPVSIVINGQVTPEDPEVITLVAGDGTITVLKVSDIKAAQSVEATFSFSGKNGTTEATGTFYSLKDILEKANIDVSNAHGLKAVASDGFVTGYTVGDVDDLYIFDMGEVVSNGQPMGEAGKFRTAINGSAGNKWATDVVTFEVATDHVWFFKGGACKHYCAICGADEHYILIGETKVYDCEITFPDVPADYTGVAKSAYGDWYYLKDGEIQADYTGIQNNAYGWWRIENGKVNFEFNGLAANEYGTWYLKDGKVDFNYTGFAAGSTKEGSGWWYVEKGQVKFDKTDILSGTANTTADLAGVSGWWYIINSKVYSGDSVAQNAYGWWVIRGGKVDFNYTGFAANTYGWWYIEKGQVNFKKNDILKGTANTSGDAEGVDGWWYIKGGKVVDETTVAQNADGWWYVNHGKVDFTYTGIKNNSNGWWRIEKGQVIFSFTGFASNEFGWWYLEKGQVNFKKNDILSGTANTSGDAEGVDGWWYVKGGKVVDETTVAQNAYGWWYVNHGKVDFTYTGFADNSYGTWYIENGQVDFKYNGTYKGRRVVNGKAQ